MEKFKKIAKIIVRIMLGVVFILSAAFKIISIDEFEIYIHSFGIFNFVVGTFLARVLIAFEFLLGVGLIFKLHYKKVWWLSILTMVGFTLFLGYVALFRSGDENCHCFGTIVEVKPLASIFKNIAIILLLFLVKNEEESMCKFRKWLVIASLSTSVIVPFVCFPMDTIYNKIVSPIQDFNQTAFNQLLQDSTMQNVVIEEEPRLFAFYVAGCRYCRLSMKKINSFFEKNHLDKSKMVVVIVGLDDHVAQFKAETGSSEYPFYVFHNEQVPIIMKTTFGSFPTFAFVKAGKASKVMDYRGLDEMEIVQFLNN